MNDQPTSRELLLYTALRDLIDYLRRKEENAENRAYLDDFRMTLAVAFYPPPAHQVLTDEVDE